MKPLPKSKDNIQLGPVVLVIMDGVGIGKRDDGDMVAKASTPNLDWLKGHALTTQLKAHGRAVGMPSDSDMGNSEVGHNAIGSGRVFDQGALLVKMAVESGAMFEGDDWRSLVDSVKANGTTLHLLGLLSDGNVHSHIDILLAMIRQARKEDVRRVRIHTLLDGRDVPPTSALEYIDRLESLLSEINGAGEYDYRIASGGGRQYITMDRYDADWPMVERGWNTHVLGRGRSFESPTIAVETMREEMPGVIDQDLKEFVITENGKPVGPVVDGDSVILFNFRGDRAIEISRTFDDPDLDTFSRDSIPDVQFAGIMEYDADEGVPKRFLVSPPAIDRPLGAYLAETGVRTLAISETQKYGHVTYFFNGNRSGKFSEELEEYVEISSDSVPFQQRPWMKCAEITDQMIQSLEKGNHDFIRANFPNGDMVGHTGDLLAVEISVEAVDLCVGRLIHAVKKHGGTLIVTADHGNADAMYDLAKDGTIRRDDAGNPRIKTSHTLNPVPCYVYQPAMPSQLSLTAHHSLGISSLAATVVKCLGYQPPEDYDPSIVDIGNGGTQ